MRRSCGQGLLARLPNGAQSAAYTAALALVAIQVGIGIIMKAAQTHGSYAFSPSGSVAISETLKMLLSVAFFYRECRRRAAAGQAPSTRGCPAEYESLPLTEWAADEDDDDGEDGEKTVEEMESQNGGPSDAGEDRMSAAAPLRLDVRMFWRYIRGEVTRDVRYGFCNLALFYVLINNSIFLSYKMADPGTIQLTKSGVTFITALVMIVTLKTRISKTQWIAIAMQICGLVVTQYNPTSGSSYPYSTYLILLFQVFLSASSGVYNQALLKTDESSLHADNMILYAAGAAINLLCHGVIRLCKADEPGFFQGYDGFGAIMVIVSNVFIGLAITAVYKYADAVVKCFATAVATGILLYISPMLFGTYLSFLVLPGTIVVFVASWLYMENPAPAPPPEQDQPQGPGFLGTMAALIRRFDRLFFALGVIVTTVVVVLLAMAKTTMADVGPAPADTTAPPAEEQTVESPFKHSLAMIRWNSAHPERIPLLMQYAPFFHAVHISMPDMLPQEPSTFHNLTHDQFPGTFTIYHQVAATMKLLLDSHPDVDGLMYYHFDAWIDPLAWADMDREKLHFPRAVKTADVGHKGPEWRCMNETKGYKWWGWEKDFHVKAMGAAGMLADLELEYEVKRHEWCVGWSDIYYIPRRFFEDFILLSDIFYAFDVFHEVAIPTMVRIIDESRRRQPFMPVVEHISDCWGDCCTSDPGIYDVLSYRCGHRLDYRQAAIAEAFYDKLAREAAVLGQRMNETRWAAFHDDDEGARVNLTRVELGGGKVLDLTKAGKGGTKGEAKGEAKDEAKTEAKSDAKSQVKTEAKSVVKADVKSGAKTAAKTEAKTTLSVKTTAAAKTTVPAPSTTAAKSKGN